MTGPLGRDWLLQHLPHRGRMNLLDEIVRWDARTLLARARSHRDGGHPLRRGAELPIAASIEYGAQAVAAHGALTAAGRGAPELGYLASARGVAFHAARLDDVAEALDIAVEKLGDAAGGVLYAFAVSAAGRALVEGRVTIILDAAVRPPETYVP